MSFLLTHTPSAASLCPLHLLDDSSPYWGKTSSTAWEIKFAITSARSTDAFTRSALTYAFNQCECCYSDTGTGQTKFKCRQWSHAPEIRHYSHRTRKTTNVIRDATQGSEVDRVSVAWETRGSCFFFWPLVQYQRSSFSSWHQKDLMILRYGMNRLLLIGYKYCHMSRNANINGSHAFLICELHQWWNQKRIIYIQWKKEIHRRSTM